MLIRLEPRGEASRAMIYQSPLIAVVLTLLAGMVMFWILGTDPLRAVHAFFIEPISTLDGVAELFVKATPLVLIGIGLSLGFQANVWNIGAEGQLTLGAVFGGGPQAVQFLSASTAAASPSPFSMSIRCSCCRRCWWRASLAAWPGRRFRRS